MTYWNPADLETVIEVVNLKAAADSNFKRLALTQPREALREVSKRAIPQGPLLTIIDCDLGYDTAPLVPTLSPARRRRAELAEIAALFVPESHSERD